MTIEPRLYRGMRDLLPSEMLVREEMLDLVRKTFRIWGFAPLATPAIEYREILVGKYGDDADKLIYRLSHKEDLALRYDLTVPLARAVAMLGNDLPTPFKRYQIQEVWRAERAQPQQGRFREFLQCDVDTVGTQSLLSDGEIIALSVELLNKLGFPNASTRVNHRALLRGLMEVCGFDSSAEQGICRIVDKLDKIGVEGVRGELLNEGFPTASVQKLFDVIERSGGNDELLDFVSLRFGDNPRIEKGLSDIRAVIEYAKAFGADEKSLKIDLSLSRGLDYYTGTIFESVIPEQPQIGSLTGGGRYDNLIGMFAGRDIPAVGITIGVDRILAALADANKKRERSAPTIVLVAVFGEKELWHSISFARELRANGIPTEVYLEDKRLKAQFAYADKQKIPFVAIIGENEIADGIVALKDMRTGEQKKMKIQEAIEILKSASSL